MKKLLVLLLVSMFVVSVAAYAADAPKADAPKADAPKADAPKADAPKADAPKAEKAPKAPKVPTYKGYLSDVLCGQAGKDPAGADLTKTPWKHEVKCMTAPDCAKSGYGLFIHDAKSKTYAFQAFDEKGNELAKAILSTAKEAAGIKLSVKGTEDKEKGTIAVVSMKQVVKKAAKKEAAKETPAKEEPKQEEPKQEEKK